MMLFFASIPNAKGFFQGGKRDNFENSGNHFSSLEREFFLFLKTLDYSQMPCERMSDGREVF
jgi:hypothetical protein